MLVLALTGDIGAGKSTLMRVLIGLHPPDSGKIFFKGQEVAIPDTKTALDMGISMIHQELSPVPDMTVAENIYLGREPLGKFGLINKRKMISDTRKLLKQLDITLDATKKMRELSIANTQMVEIAKALSAQARILIMDEPSAVLPSRDLDRLFEVIKTLRAQGHGIIYISHRLNEIFELADRVTVLKDGQSMATRAVTATSHGELIRLSTNATPAISPDQTVQVVAKPGKARWYDAAGHLMA